MRAHVCLCVRVRVCGRGEREQALAEGLCTKSTRKGGKEGGGDREIHRDKHTPLSFSLLLVYYSVNKNSSKNGAFFKEEVVDQVQGSLSAYMSFTIGRARGRKWKDCSMSLIFYIFGWQNDQCIDSKC